MTTTASCKHYWVIDSPAGPESRGVCRICSEVKIFSNHLDGLEWHIDSSRSLLDDPTYYNSMKQSARLWSPKGA